MLHARIGHATSFRRWLFAPPLRGRWAVLCAALAIAIPTLIRLATANPMDQYQCLTFCPFVLAAAILIDWEYAAMVAIGSTIVCNIFLMGRPYGFHGGTAELAGMSVGLAYSASIIGLVVFARSTARRSLTVPGCHERRSGIIFSLESGQAWATWRGCDAPVRLGSQEEVASMMQDFLAQVELGNRLSARCECPNPATPQSSPQSRADP